jgi:hypothetical protein
MAEVDWLEAILCVPRGRRAGDLDEDSPEAAFVGGMRLGGSLRGYNATWPLARLTLVRDGFRIERSARLLPVPSWAARYDELTEVQAVGKISLFTTGVRFRASDGAWVVFWTRDRIAVMEAFASRGVAVNTEPIRFNFLHPER